MKNKNYAFAVGILAAAIAAGCSLALSIMGYVVAENRIDPGGSFFALVGGFGVGIVACVAGFIVSLVRLAGQRASSQLQP